jgi:hypothetical protein
MSFSTGRQLAMESLKNAVESIQREKRRRKEKRKQRLETYKQQKEEKVLSIWYTYKLTCVYQFSS